MAAEAKAPVVGKDGTVIQDDDERKYDRQMRLWGSHGQKRLQEAHIAVLHAGPTSSETLKNLVLPNIGAFTLIDGEKTSASDLGNNWFVDDEHVGKSRAATVTELLLEMNPEVKGTHIDADPVAYVETKLESFASFQVVVACQLPEATVRKLSAFLFPRNIPLVIVRTHGLFGYMRTVTAEQTIVESHPMNDRSDIYVNPKQIALWPALAKYCESFDFAKADLRTHRHIPYIAILHQQMQVWLKAHNNKPPASSAEKKAFRDQIDGARTKDPASPAPEDNFNEAVQNAFRAFDVPELDDRVTAVLSDAKGQPQNITKDSTNYWIMVAALNAWRADPKGGAGVLMPVSTNIPDMHSFSDYYITLKDIFAAKAKDDLTAITAHAHAIASKVGRADPTPRELDLFVKNCRSLYVVRTRALEDEYNPKTFNTEDINDKLTDYVDLQPDEKEQHVLKGPLNLAWYFGIRGVDAFYAKNKRYPGVFPDGKEDIAGDVEALTALVAQQYSDNKVDGKADDAVIAELVRYGASEPHSVAAFMGGMGAQEVLKLLIGQYVPNNNTVLYNAVHGSLTRAAF